MIPVTRPDNPEYPPISPYSVGETTDFIEKLKSIRDKENAPQLPYFVQSTRKGK